MWCNMGFLVIWGRNLMSSGVLRLLAVSHDLNLLGQFGSYLKYPLQDVPSFFMGLFLLSFFDNRLYSVIFGSGSGWAL